MPRDSGRSDNHVALAGDLGQFLALATVEHFILRPRVPTRVLGVASIDVQFHKLGPKALDLFFDRWPHIVRPNDRS